MKSIQRIKEFYRSCFPERSLSLEWVQRDNGSWLARNTPESEFRPPRSKFSRAIEGLARKTNEIGNLPVWEGYGANNTLGPSRSPDQVRTSSAIGDLFTHLVRLRKPEFVVEFGTAFGVSGMYFLAGLVLNAKGKLLTFEPNAQWAIFARQNLSLLGSYFDLTVGTFEENIDSVLRKDQQIDIAFIDAIHTKEFVIPQMNLVIERCNAKAIIVFDDIFFSENMQDCWEEVSNDSRFSSSVVVGGKIGLVELG